jgi:hypothetical protein
MTDAEQPGPESENEGEGSRSADREYREGVRKHLEKGHVQDEAEKASEDVDSSPEEYRKAEEAGKSHSAGEAPGDTDRI